MLLSLESFLLFSFHMDEFALLLEGCVSLDKRVKGILDNSKLPDHLQKMLFGWESDVISTRKAQLCSTHLGVETQLLSWSREDSC